MSLLKFFQVQDINPKCESFKTSDYMLLTYKINQKKCLLVIYCNS